MTADEMPCWHDWCGAGKWWPWQRWRGQLGCTGINGKLVYTEWKCQTFRAVNEWPVYRIVFWVDIICQTEVHVIWSCRINVRLGSVLLFVRPVILELMLSQDGQYQLVHATMRIHPHSWHGSPELGRVVAGIRLSHTTNYSYLRRQGDGMYVVTVLSTPPQMYDLCHRGPKCHGLYRAVCGLVRRQ
jgi:hypothetical protein